MARVTGLNLKINQNRQVVKEGPASNLNSQERTGLPATNDSSSLSQYSNGEDWFQYDNKDLGFSIMLDNYLKDSGGGIYLGTTIKVASVQNETQVDQFIKSSYGQSCVVKKTYLYGSDKDSVYSITATDAMYGNTDLSGCGLRNEMGYKVLYSPSIHKIIGLVLGQQECLFGQLSGQVCFDQLILASLKFND